MPDLTDRRTPGVFYSERGHVLHLYMPGYRVGMQAMCGVPAWRTAETDMVWLGYFPTSLDYPMRYCRPCIGHAAGALDLIRNLAEPWFRQYFGSGEIHG